MTIWSNIVCLLNHSIQSDGMCCNVDRFPAWRQICTISRASGKSLFLFLYPHKFKTSVGMSMDYPFPPFFNLPQARLHTSAMKTSPTRRNRNLIAASKQTTFTVVLTIALLFWMLRPFISSPKQLDKVPFSQNSVEEYVHVLVRQRCCWYA